MKYLLYSIIFFTTTLSYAQTIDKFEPFNRTDYPKDKFQITSDSIEFKDFLIEVRQVRNMIGYGPFSCRAWLTVRTKSKPVYQRYFKSIDAVGNCYGLFVPLKQPRQDYFIISKLGDYNGRIFIIDSKGNVTEKPGGQFAVSKDKRYLFSDYNSDESGLTVFDFSTGQTLFSETITPRLVDWYYKDNKFISRVDLLNGKISTDEYYYFDLSVNKLVLLKGKKDYLKPEDRLLSYNDKNTRRFCNCGPELLPRQK